MSLTDRQQAVLDYLRQHLATHGRPPTIWEVAEAFGLATADGVAKAPASLGREGVYRLGAWPRPWHPPAGTEPTGRGDGPADPGSGGRGCADWGCR